MPTHSPISDEDYVIVQFARTLPALDAGWITTTWIEWTGGSEGLGNQLGEAFLRQHFGVRTDQGLGSFFPSGGRRRFVNIGQAPDLGRQGDTGSVNDSMAGAIIRVLKSSPTGSVTINGYTFEPFWWGVCRGPISEPDGSAGNDVGGSAGWQCVDIRSVLDQIVTRESYALSPITSKQVRIGRLLPFNRSPAGDCTASTYALPGGTVHIHSLSTESAEPWSALRIIETLIATAARGDVDGTGAATGWDWVVSDPDSVLFYQPQAIDLAGLTLFQQINVLANADRGITWYATVSGETVVLHFVSVSAGGVTVGSESLPPSSFTAELDIRGNAALGSCTVVEDWDSVYDIIEVRGARPWVTMTLLLDTAEAVLKGSGHGWLAGQDVVWGSDPEASGTDDVWRRFRLSASWNGQQYNESAIGLANVLSRGTDGGYSGERSYDPAKGIPPAWEIDFERLTCGSPSFGIVILAPRQPPVVVVGNTTWEDMSQQWQVQVDTSPPSIRIDEGENGTVIQSRLAAGEKILMTVGVREVDPLRVSWHRPAGQRPNASPRIKVVTLPTCEQWKVLQGTVTSVSPGGALETSGGITVRDDVPRMRQALAMLVASFSEPAVAVRWSVRANLDIGSTYRTGRLLTTLTRGEKAQTVNSVITRRSWSMAVQPGDGFGAGEVAYWVTSYDTQHMAPTLQALT